MTKCITNFGEKEFRFYVEPNSKEKNIWYSNDEIDWMSLYSYEFIIQIKLNGKHYYEFPQPNIPPKILIEFFKKFHDELIKIDEYSKKIEFLKTAEERIKYEK